MIELAGAARHRLPVFSCYTVHMTMYFVTGNAGKLREVQGMIPDIQGLDLDLVEIQHNDAHHIIEAKLNEAAKYHDGTIIVDDTSLYIESLNGLPGPLIKWFLKALGDDGLARMAAAMCATDARAETLLGLREESGEITYFSGSIDGTIVAPRGTDGFGWDTIFQPNGHSKTFAEMTTDEKNQLSMRRLAVSELKKYLTQKP